MSMVPQPGSRTVMQNLTQKAMYLQAAFDKARGILYCARQWDATHTHSTIILLNNTQEND